MAVSFTWRKGKGSGSALFRPAADIGVSTGCSLYVLARDGADWRVVTRTTVTQTPIGVPPTSTNGWRDLAVSIGGGGAEAGWVRLAFDGRTYPTNPTMAPAAPLDGQPDITTLIASDPEFRSLP